MEGAAGSSAAGRVARRGGDGPAHAPGGRRGLPAARAVAGRGRAGGRSVRGAGPTGCSPRVGRCRAVVIGPGPRARRADPRRGPPPRRPVPRCPVVLDADGLAALDDADQLRQAIAEGSRPVVLTPHDGEYRPLARGAARTGPGGGGPPPGGGDRGGRPRQGPAHGRPAAPDGAAGDPRSCWRPPGRPPWPPPAPATSSRGSSGAFVARGARRRSWPPPWPRTSTAGRPRPGPAEGLVAGDLPALVAAWLSDALDPREHRREDPRDRGPPPADHGPDRSRRRPPQRGGAQPPGGAGRPVRGREGRRLRPRRPRRGAGRASRAGATWLAVALVDEGIELREAGIAAPILVLSEPAADAVADAVGAGLDARPCTASAMRALVERSAGALGVAAAACT